MPTKEKLSIDQLCHRCDPEIFEFETTEELEELTEIIGQPRAVDAIRFGVGIGSEGYNIFAHGPTGTRKRELVQRFFDRAASEDTVPDDWCYVNNFENTHKPLALRFPAGRGSVFRQDMETLVEDLKNALTSVFESEEYRTRMQEVQEGLSDRQENALAELREKAEEEDLSIIRTPAGLAIAPVREGEVIAPEEFEKLPEEERKQLEEEISKLQEELQRVMRQVPVWQRETREQINELNREMARLAVGSLIEELKEKYSDLEEVVAYLDDLLEDVVHNVREIVSDEDQQNQMRMLGLRQLQSQAGGGDSPLLRRYRANLLVDNSQSEGAPVVFEDNPSYLNLLGRLEHIAQMGALMTDFNLIKPGALHRANGGYLLLELDKVLLQPYAWEGLKRTLRSGQIKIESPAQMYSLISTVSLEPEPIPVDVKVALIGEPLLYYLVSELDPEFVELFKVAADFGGEMDRDEESQQLYARLIGDLARKEGLRFLSRGAVARVIEQSARWVGDGEKLSTQTRDIIDLLRESDYWAGGDGSEVIQTEHVQKAIDSKIYRSDRIREQVQELILRDTILIDTEGGQVGQVNGLSVYNLADFTFGRPNRITARVRMGKGEVVDIEREVELGGPIHAKGVLILSSYLGARYASKEPLSLAASLVFEQSYSGVEGDSASSAELYALLSAIADVPLLQDLSVTGSVNQRGQVQAIGGVNEKIEGFFDICKARGLNGKQGVIIPVSNEKHLMLRQEVVDAVAEDNFHIYSVETIDEGIELLTGMEAGETDEEGNFPPDSFNGKVQARLKEFAERRAEFSSDDEEGEDE